MSEPGILNERGGPGTPGSSPGYRRRPSGTSSRPGFASVVERPPAVVGGADLQPRPPRLELGLKDDPDHLGDYPVDRLGGSRSSERPVRPGDEADRMLGREPGQLGAGRGVRRRRRGLPRSARGSRGGIRPAARARRRRSRSQVPRGRTRPASAARSRGRAGAPRRPRTSRCSRTPGPRSAARARSSPRSAPRGPRRSRLGL